MATTNNYDPYVTYRYRVDFAANAGGADVPTRTGFQSVSGLSVSVGTMNYREGDENLTIVRKIPGLTKVGNVTLKWGLIFDSDTASFFNWLGGHTSINENGPTGDFTLMDVTITLLALGEDAATGGADGPKWVLKRCYPLSFAVPELKAESDGLAISSMELAVGSFDFTPPTASYSSVSANGDKV